MHRKRNFKLSARERSEKTLQFQLRSVQKTDYGSFRVFFGITTFFSASEYVISSTLQLMSKLQTSSVDVTKLS